MRSRPAATAAIAGIVLGSIAAGSAFADTCTDRQKVCFAYCDRQYNGSTRCMDACRTFLATCLTTGCWESRVTAKRCGFTPQ